MRLLVILEDPSFSTFGHHSRAHRFKDEQRYRHDDDVHGGGEQEHKVPTASRCFDHVGDRNQESGSAFRRIKQAEIHRRELWSEGVGAG